MHLQEIFDLTLTMGIALYIIRPMCPLHHTTYVTAKFEVATASG